MEKINLLIVELRKLADDLKMVVSEDNQNEYEFKLFELNIALAEFEFIYEEAEQKLDDEMDEAFLKQRSLMKSDKATEMTIKSTYQEQIKKVSNHKSMVKKYNRIHRWLLRIADFVTSKKIQANFEKKSQWY